MTKTTKRSPDAAQVALTVKCKCKSCGEEEWFLKASSDRLCYNCIMGKIDPEQPDAELKAWLLKDKYGKK